MAKQIYTASARVENNVGTLFLHPFTPRERGSSNILNQTVPWPIGGTITSFEAEIGTALAGTDTELTAAPLLVALFINESEVAGSERTLSTFQSSSTVALSETITAGDRISIRLRETTAGQTWRGFVNVRFIFDSPTRGKVIGGSTGEQLLVQGFHMFPSNSSVGSGTLVQSLVPVTSSVSRLNVYRNTTSGISEYFLQRNFSDVVQSVVVSGVKQAAATQDPGGFAQGDSLTMRKDSGDDENISWSALVRSV